MIALDPSRARRYKPLHFSGGRSILVAIRVGRQGSPRGRTGRRHFFRGEGEHLWARSPSIPCSVWTFHGAPWPPAAAAITTAAVALRHDRFKHAEVPALSATSPGGVDNVAGVARARLPAVSHRIHSTATRKIRRRLVGQFVAAGRAYPNGNVVSEDGSIAGNKRPDRLLARSSTVIPAATAGTSGNVVPWRPGCRRPGRRDAGELPANHASRPPRANGYPSRHLRRVPEWRRERVPGQPGFSPPPAPASNNGTTHDLLAGHDFVTSAARPSRGGRRSPGGPVYNVPGKAN